MQSIRTRSITPRLPNILVSLLSPALLTALQSCGAPYAEELCLHHGRHATVRAAGRIFDVDHVCDAHELSELLKRMCGGSLYTYEATINEGFVTLEGGIRVGICGRAAVQNGRIIGVGEITGLTLRIPTDHGVSCARILDLLSSDARGLLIYAPPGVGKTTLLRSLAREAASPSHRIRTVVVDTREELGALASGKDLMLDILSGYPRGRGIEIAVRSLGARLILCDEIGNPRDASAILESANCGVPVVASAHACSVSDLLSRPSLLRLHEAHVFGYYIGLERRGSSELRYSITNWLTAESVLIGSR